MTSPSSDLISEATREYRAAQKTPVVQKNNRGAIVSAPLIRAHAVDLADDLASLAISLREALWRGSDVLVDIHADEIRLVWREIIRSYNELKKIEGGR